MRRTLYRAVALAVFAAAMWPLVAQMDRDIRDAARAAQLEQERKQDQDRRAIYACMDQGGRIEWVYDLPICRTGGAR